METKAAKYTFWGVIIAATIGAGAVIYEANISSNTELKAIEPKKDEIISKPHLTINNVYTTPKETNLLSGIYFEVRNNGSVPALHPEIVMDFGKTQVTDCEVGLNQDSSVQLNSGGSIAQFKIGDLKPNTYNYVYCLANSPKFESILFSADDVRATTFEFSDIKASGEGFGYLDYFKVLLTIVATIFIIFLTVWFLGFIYKNIKDKIHLDPE